MKPRFHRVALLCRNCIAGILKSEGHSWLCRVKVSLFLQLHQKYVTHFYYLIFTFISLQSLGQLTCEVLLLSECPMHLVEDGLLNAMENGGSNCESKDKHLCHLRDCSKSSTILRKGNP